MKTEEVKYVYQEGPLLVPEKNNGAVYQETTIANNRSQQKPLKGNSKKPKSWWSRHLFSRFPLVLSSLALIVCVVVIIVLLTNGTSREQAQEAEIAKLTEQLESQQTRLHRMQKELQFLNSRLQAYDAREESFKRRSQLPIVALPPNVGTGTGINSWPAPEPKLSGEGDLIAADPDMPMLPVREAGLSTLDEEVDVSKLPQASPNKKRKGKLASLSNEDLPSI